MAVPVQQVRLSALTSSSRRTAVLRRPTQHRTVDTAGQPCRVRYAVLTDKLAARQRVEVCGGQNGSRERHVYVSTGNVVEISIDVRRDNPDYFVLLYEGRTTVTYKYYTGCPKIGTIFVRLLLLLLLVSS